MLRKRSLIFFCSLHPSFISDRPLDQLAGENMFTKTTVRQTLNLLVSVCLVLALVPISIGHTTSPFPAALKSAEPMIKQTAALVHYPAPLSQSLSIARAQSSYTAGTLQVTFTVFNNLPVTRLPDVPPGATDDQIADILAAFNPLQDANTLHGIILTDTLAAGVTLITASGNVQQTGNTLTWQLSDLAPLSSTQVTLTLQTPSVGSNFIDLDDGAQATALG
jgi:hypothetical protein